jgi:peptidoglycan/LPS O-acetylase OafA/YrhL
MPALLLFIFFLFVVKDNSVFGLLATPAAKLLGTISYSIYLLHCIVVFVVVALANRYSPISAMPMQTYMLLIVAAALITVFLSTLTYRHIEHPFLSTTGVAAPARMAVGGTAGGITART